MCHPVNPLSHLYPCGPSPQLLDCFFFTVSLVFGITDGYSRCKLVELLRYVRPFHPSAASLSCKVL